MPAKRQTKKPKADQIFAYCERRLEQVQAESRAKARAIVQQESSDPLPVTAKGRGQEILSFEERSLSKYLNDEMERRYKRRQFAIDRSKEIRKKAREEASKRLEEASKRLEKTIKKCLEHPRCSRLLRRKIKKQRTLVLQVQTAERMIKQWELWEAEDKKKSDRKIKRTLRKAAVDQTEARRPDAPALRNSRYATLCAIMPPPGTPLV